VVKHAGVDRATVTLTVDSDNTLLVRVQDAGRGFDVSSVKPNGAGDHFGLASIQEQMAAMGGWLHEESAIGRGTTTTLGLPLMPLWVVRSESAASSLRQDRVRAKTLEPPAQESLPLG
jgi:signal transduction histidine kinase